MDGRQAARLAALALVGVVSGCGGDPAAPAMTDLTRPLRSRNGVFTVVVAPDGGAFRRGNNVLRVRVTEPASGESWVAGVDGTMPAMGHTAQSAEVSPDPAGGEEVSGLVLAMAGWWHFTVRLESPGASDEVVIDAEAE